MPGESWAWYATWADAIVAELFPPERAGGPAYLDLEEDIVGAIWDRLGRPGPSAEESLGAAVSATLDHEHGDIFRAHRIRLNAWETTGRRGHPPTLPLLAVLSLAAESMATGEGMRSTNYYGRLAPLLLVPDGAAANRLESAYREIAQRLWASLNDWLELCGGERGLPTAYAFGANRHIGLPMSQALIRAADRRGLRRRFAAIGLAPGEVIGTDDMVAILDAWLRPAGSSAGLRLQRIWAGGDSSLRDRIAEVAALELEAWPGETEADSVGGETAGAPQGGSRLIAVLRTFLTRRLELGLDFRPVATIDGPDVPVGVGDSSGRVVQSRVTVLADDWRRIGELGSIAEGALAGSQIRILGPSGDELASHRPRALYCLAKDDATGVYIERERAMLGVDLLILTADRLLDDVLETIAPVARSGYQAMNAGALDGVPAGWTLLSGVQIMAAPSDASNARNADELAALIPVALSQLVVAGGMALPGIVRRWSSMAPPEIRALYDRPGALTLDVACIRRLAPGSMPEPVVAVADEGRAIILPLAGRSLPDGDYEATMRHGSSDRTAGHRVIRLRSADSPEAAAAGGSLVHAPGVDPLWALSAMPREEAAHDVVRGGQVDADTISDTPLRQAWAPPNWRTHGLAPTPVGTTRDEFGVAPTAVCILTGSHYWDIDEVQAGGRAGMVRGRCRTCSLVRRYPATWQGIGAARRQEERRLSQHVVAALPRITRISAIPLAEVERADAAVAALDAVFHVRGGATQHLAHIAWQLEASSLFAYRLARALEDLGHIEVSRDDGLRMTRWEATEPCLAQLANERDFLLVGAIGQRSLTQLAALVIAADGQVRTEVDDLGLPRRVVGDVEPATLERICRSVEAPYGGSLRFSIAPARRLATLLPALSSVIGSIGARRPPGHRSSEKYDVALAAWRSVDRIEAPGGYRLTGHGMSYVVRLPGDPPGTVRIADARLVRFGAALLAGETLIAYDRDRRILEVPLGAALPGLYGRSAVLAGGWLPRRSQDGRALVYLDVPADIASALLSRLTA